MSKPPKGGGDRKRKRKRARSAAMDILSRTATNMILFTLYLNFGYWLTVLFPEFIVPDLSDVLV